jgi:hypothetical protein
MPRDRIVRVLAQVRARGAREAVGHERKSGSEAYFTGYARARPALPAKYSFEPD